MYLNLITDRAQSDVDALKDLYIKGWNDLTEAEKELFLDLSSKGAYNTKDMTRVDETIKSLADLLILYGYPTVVSPKINWQAKEIPTSSQLAIYLRNVASVREAIHVPSNTPSTPVSMEDLTFDAANDIEKILFNVNAMIECLEDDFLYCGTFTADTSKGGQHFDDLFDEDTAMYFITSEGLDFYTANNEQFIVG